MNLSKLLPVFAGGIMMGVSRSGIPLLEKKKEGDCMSKSLVAYFSASGVTKEKAEKLAKAAGADLYEIKPEIPYSHADLNWMDPNSRSSKEMKDKSSRPAMAARDANIADYDTIFVGFPIWWYVAPHIINSFLEAYDFSGKKIVLFATSGSSGFGNTAAELKPSVSPDTEIVEGKILNGTLSEEDLKAWSQTVL
jgi:flavodoxin